MKKVVVTNNSLVLEKKDKNVEILFFDCTYLELLIKVRDMVFLGQKLLSHPLSGSVKPNETPFKTVLLDSCVSTLNYDDVLMIENSIITCKKFPIKYPELPQKVADDFRLVDYLLVKDLMI